MADESWTVKGITVDKIEDADKLDEATPEKAEEIAVAMRADGKKTSSEAIAEVASAEDVKG